jgi:Family of unknown function (DUF5947)
MSAVRALRRFVREAARCDLCGAAIGEGHPHLVDPRRRELKCACPACAVLLPEGRFRRVPPHVEPVRIEDRRWDALGLPVGLAFFSRSGGKVTAFYPSPAGATESSVPLDAWDSLGVELEDDLEGLIVRRIGSIREHYRVSIDACYRLSGLLRLHWQGFSGGVRASKEIDRFFARLRGESA